MRSSFQIRIVGHRERSLSDADRKLFKSHVQGFDLDQRVILNAGAGFLVVTTGAIMRMPGLPKKPAAYTIDVVDGKITGLS